MSSFVLALNEKLDLKYQDMKFFLFLMISFISLNANTLICNTIQRLIFYMDYKLLDWDLWGFHTKLLLLVYCKAGLAFALN